MNDTTTDLIKLAEDILMTPYRIAHLPCVCQHFGRPAGIQHRAERQAKCTICGGTGAQIVRRPE